MQVQQPDINNCTIKQWEKWWWQDYNEMCKKCIFTCLQSWRINLSCPKFKEIKNETNK